MQLGIRLHDAAALPLEQRLDAVTAQGFSCVHLALSKVLHAEYAKPGALTPGFAMHLRRLFADRRLDIAVLGCYLNLAHPEQEALASIQRTYEAHIRFAAHLGCGVVGTETGAPNPQYSYEPACHSEEALATFIRNLKPVVRFCEQMGVLFAIEPVYTHIVSNGRRARRVLDEIASPNLQIILDPVNLLHKENVHQRSEVIAEAIELLRDEIAVVHLKDYSTKEDGTLKSVAAGTGEMDYSDIFSFIRKEKPWIHATLENTTPENAESSRRHMEKLWNEAGSLQHS